MKEKTSQPLNRSEFYTAINWFAQITKQLSEEQQQSIVYHSSTALWILKDFVLTQKTNNIQAERLTSDIDAWASKETILSLQRLLIDAGFSQIFDPTIPLQKMQFRIKQDSHTKISKTQAGQDPEINLSFIDAHGTEFDIWSRISSVNKNDIHTIQSPFIDGTNRVQVLKPEKLRQWYAHLIQVETDTGNPKVNQRIKSLQTLLKM